MPLDARLPGPEHWTTTVNDAAHLSDNLDALNARPETTPSDRIRVVIVDDHALVREGTRQILELASDIDVVALAGSAEEGLSVLHGANADVVLVDINLPGMSGLELAREVATSMPDVRVLILSAFDEHAYISEALEIGVGGYLLKTTSGKELIDAVRAVADGIFVLDHAVSQRLIRRRRRGPDTVSSLTRRETDVLELLARGRSNKQIAASLELGLRTVESHVSNLLGKLGVTSRTEAVTYALNHHLVEPLSYDGTGTSD
ncbi:MAG TPA: response regulator transcription factor [Acidimicrobiales bacterium]|nr:response regulator transcription factor [Acidimicrobiales bacterium]